MLVGHGRLYESIRIRPFVFFFFSNSKKTLPCLPPRAPELGVYRPRPGIAAGNTTDWQLPVRRPLIWRFTNWFGSVGEKTERFPLCSPAVRTNWNVLPKRCTRIRRLRKIFLRAKDVRQCTRTVYIIQGLVLCKCVVNLYWRKWWPPRSRHLLRGDNSDVNTWIFYEIARSKLLKIICSYDVVFDYFCEFRNPHQCATAIEWTENSF